MSRQAFAAYQTGAGKMPHGTVVDPRVFVAKKTLDQWIASTGHRKNLLLHNASRVGVASVTSAISHRTYWAMEIAGEYEPLPAAASKKTPPATKRKSPVQSCRVRILSICF
jgi:hypothetical protein